MFPTRAHAWLAVLLVAGATTWLGLVIATPAWDQPGSRTATRATAIAFRALGARVCHQRPDRSFHVDGRPWPVCARCGGLYAGAAAGAWVALWGAWSIARRGGPLRAEAFRWPLVIAAAPTAMTWAAEYAGGVPVSNVVRFALAIPLGATGAWLLTSMAAGRIE